MRPAVALSFLPFAGLGLELDSRIERVTEPREMGAALDRWKAWRDEEGFDVEVLGADDGSAIVGLGYRYRPSERL